MTKQEIKRDIQAMYPGSVWLNTNDTAKVIRRNRTEVRAFMKDYPSQRSGNGKFYLIGDIADRLYEGMQYGN